jgi:formate C-acetyltransferase
MEHLGGGHNISQLKVLELALNDGFDPRTKKQLGPHTGDVRTFTSIDRYWSLLQSAEYLVPRLMMFKTISLATRNCRRAMSGRVAMQFDLR